MGTPIDGKDHTSPLAGDEKVPLSPDGYATTQEIADLSPGGGGSFPDFTGSGSPEGIQTADVGQSYVDTTNGAIYEKTQGAATDTGWTLVGGFDPDYATPGFNGSSDTSFDVAVLANGSVGQSASLTDTQAQQGSGNSLRWNTTGVDGEQWLQLALGNFDKLTEFAADGSTSFPGPITQPSLNLSSDDGTDTFSVQALAGEFDLGIVNNGNANLFGRVALGESTAQLIAGDDSGNASVLVEPTQVQVMLGGPVVRFSVADGSIYSDGPIGVNGVTPPAQAALIDGTLETSAVQAIIAALTDVGILAAS